MPYFTSALFTCSGLVWKAGIAAEVLCQPQMSIGAKLFDAKSMLETVDVFVWTTVIIIISLLLEKAVKLLLLANYSSNYNKKTPASIWIAGVFLFKVIYNSMGI